MVALIFTIQFSFRDVICCVSFSKFSVTMTAKSTLTFLSNSEIEKQIIIQSLDYMSYTSEKTFLLDVANLWVTTEKYLLSLL